MRDQEGQNNWIVRIVAFLVACVLWIYVMNEQNPLIERSFTVPLEKVHLAAEMVVSNVPDTVMLKIRGTRTALSGLEDKDLHAVLELGGLAKGRHNINIKTKVPVGEIVEITPRALSIDMDTLGERTMEIEARIVGVPNSGVTVGKMEMVPNRVTVAGASSRIANISKVVALVDISEKDKNFETEANLTPISLDGTEMYDLGVTPNKVYVKAIMLKQLATDNVAIKPVFVGALMRGYKLSAVEAVPAKIKLTAEPSVLAGLTDIKTAPIALDSITGDIEVQMPLVIPDKILAENHMALIKIKIEKE
ncbi:MAG: CdaR family protein [Acidaminococcaceae bacterium]